MPLAPPLYLLCCCICIPQAKPSQAKPTPPWSLARGHGPIVVTSSRRQPSCCFASLRYATLRSLWFSLVPLGAKRIYLLTVVATANGESRGRRRDTDRTDAWSPRCDAMRGARMEMEETRGCQCQCQCQCQRKDAAAAAAAAFNSNRVRASTARVVLVLRSSTTPFQRTVLYVLASALDSLSIWEPHLLLTLSILLGVDLI
jgi:hypothetical protein